MNFCNVPETISYSVILFSCPTLVIRSLVPEAFAWKFWVCATCLSVLPINPLKHCFTVLTHHWDTSLLHYCCSSLTVNITDIFPFFYHCCIVLFKQRFRKITIWKTNLICLKHDSRFNLSYILVLHNAQRIMLCV